jgi:DNA-binding NarL/FixJ family response regulator
VVEDHPMVREGMRSLIDGTMDLIVCGEAGTPDAAVETFRREKPDVVCLDLMLGAVDATPLIGRLRAEEGGARILVLSVKDEEMFAERCLQAGALGYLMKTESNDALLEGLRKVAAGEVFLSTRIAMMVLNRVHQPVVKGVGTASLSEREGQVFQLVGLALTTRQIAERLGIGIKTVETHRENIKNKLGLPHGAALVYEAMKWVKQTLDGKPSP